MIVPMERVRIAGPQPLADSVIAAIAQIGAFHIDNSADDPIFDKSGLAVGALDQEKTKLLSEMEALLGDVHQALSVLREANPERKEILGEVLPSRDWLNLERRRELGKVAKACKESAAQARRLRDELSEVREYRSIFEEFYPLVKKIASFRGVETDGLFFREPGPKTDQLIATIKEAMEETTKGAYTLLESATRRAPVAIMIVYPVTLKDKVRKMALDPMAREIQTIKAPHRLEKESLAATLLNMFRVEHELEKELEKQKEILEAYSRNWTLYLAMGEGELKAMVDELRAGALLAVSEQTFWITGWIPAREREAVANVIKDSFGGKAAFFHHTPLREEYEKVPSCLHNGKLTKPFERLLAIFPAPMYGSFDPTPLMAIFFPLFFGLTLGDLGYAIILAFLAWFIRSRRPGDVVWRDITAIMFACAFMAALFGLAYGEFFGKFWTVIGLPAPFFHRKEEVVTLLLFALAVGGAHVFLGALAGVKTALAAGQNDKAIVKITDATFLVAAFYTAFQAFTGGPVITGITIALLTFIVKIAAGGAIELIEAARLFSSVLSYARLMAIGIASIIFADMADDIYLNSESVAMGLTGLIVVHLVNFFFGVFDPAIQAIRLHYVEFFNQFYQHGSVRYSPLGKR